MLHYFDVYNSAGEWVGFYDYEWQAEAAAKSCRGHYEERSDAFDFPL